MASLTSRTVASSYKELLKTVSPLGVSANLTAIEDGAGTQSPLNLSSTQVKISNLATDGFSVAAQAAFSFAVTAADTVSLTKASGTALSVTANATVGGTLAVTGAASVGSISMAGSASIGGNLTLTGTINGTAFPANKTLVTTVDTQTLTNKTLSGSNNTFSNIPNTAITGLGTLSTQNANSISVSGGSISGVSLSGLTAPLALGSGGTGLSTVGAATTVLAPTSTGILAYKTLSAGTNVTITQSDSAIQISATGGGGGGGIASVSADATPSLGGNLDVQTFSIVSSSNRNISITPGGTGTTIISKVATPSASTDAANKSYVDTHSSRTDNPHSVTASQVGRDTAQWNANKIQGRTVSASSPTNGQVLTYNSTTTQYEPASPVAVPNGFWGFKLTDGTTTTKTHLTVDYGSGSFLKSDYRDSMFAPFVSVAVDSNGHLVGTF